MKKLKKVGNKKPAGDWKNELRQALEKRVIVGLPLTLRRIAIDEIMSGTEYCVDKKLKIVSTTLAANFDVGSECGCLLAKNHRSRNFFKARDKFGLTNDQTFKLGFNISPRWQEATDGFTMPYWQKSLGLWKKVYNIFWPEVGMFFKENPQYGVV